MRALGNRATVQVPPSHAPIPLKLLWVGVTCPCDGQRNQPVSSTDWTKAMSPATPSARPSSMNSRASSPTGTLAR
jgi:hypothetical protein